MNCNRLLCQLLDIGYSNQQKVFTLWSPRTSHLQGMTSHRWLRGWLVDTASTGQSRQASTTHREGVLRQRQTPVCPLRGRLLRPSTWHRRCVLSGCAEAGLITKNAGAWRGGPTPLALPPTSSLCSTPATSTLAVYFFLCSLTTQELSVASPHCCSLFIECEIVLLFSLQC